MVPKKKAWLIKDIATTKDTTVRTGAASSSSSSSLSGGLEYVAPTHIPVPRAPKKDELRDWFALKNDGSEAMALNLKVLNEKNVWTGLFMDVCAVMRRLERE